MRAGPGGTRDADLAAAAGLEGLEGLAERWRAAWPEALAAWGRTSRLHAPVLARPVGVGVPSFAWFDLARVTVHVDLADVVRLGLEDHAVAVLAHEVGHHLLAPVDRRTTVRIAARVRAGLVDHDHLVPAIANLWADLLINDRLQRSGRADLAGVWRALGAAEDPIMALVLRADEILWGLPARSLAGRAVPVDDDAAWLCARLARAYAQDPVGGAAGFAALVRTAIGEDALREPASPALLRLTCADAGDEHGLPSGLGSDPTLAGPVVHPVLDPAVTGTAPADAGTAASAPLPPVAAREAGALGRGRGEATGSSTLLPPDLHAVLAALGDPTTLEEVAIAWYRDRASAHLVPFPVDRTVGEPEPLLGGYEPWEVGDDLGDVDWTGTVTASPVVVPGRTTLRRQTHDDVPAFPDERPLDLDLYLDSSGSMPDPKRFSAVALAGAVLALSALRVGARVQATTWSGPGQVAGTDGFTRDATAVLRAVVAHFGGGTAFPVDLLCRTYLGGAGAAPTTTRRTHVAVVSDSGVRTLFAPRDRRDPRTTDTATAGQVLRALERAAGGTSLLLDVPAPARAVTAEALPDDVDVYWVDADTPLVEVAEAFARRHWGSRGRHGSAGSGGRR